MVCYKDQLISQVAQTVASFFLSEPLLARLDETLKRRSRQRRGPVAQGAGAAAGREAGRVARRSCGGRIDKTPTSEPIRSLLVKVMLALLRHDFAANFALAEELDKLVTDPAQRREVLRLRVQGLAQSGPDLGRLSGAPGAGRSGAGQRDAAVRRSERVGVRSSATWPSAPIAGCKGSCTSCCSAADADAQADGRRDRGAAEARAASRQRQPAPRVL